MHLTNSVSSENGTLIDEFGSNLGIKNHLNLRWL